MSKVRDAFAAFLLVALVVILALIRSEEESHRDFHIGTERLFAEQHSLLRDLSAQIREDRRVLGEIFSTLQAEKQKTADYYEQVLPRLDESNELQRQRNGKM